MNNIIKISIVTGTVALAFGFFALVPSVVNTIENTFSPATVFAWGDSGCGGCDSGGGESPGGESHEFKPAICYYLNSNKNTVPAGGGNVTLSWKTGFASSAYINNGVGNVNTIGSKTVNVTKNTTFTLTAKAYGGNDTCTVTITVEEPEEPATCDAFSVSPTSLPYGGGNVTLTWNTTNADSVYINNGVGSVADDGSKTVFVDSDTTFTLTAKGTGGNDTCTATVKVNDPKPATCDSFTASPKYLPYGGGNVTLTWNTTNADSVYINNGVGYVSDDGSKTVFVSDDTTFTLTVDGVNNDDTCTVTVKVDEQDEPAVCDAFTVSPTNLPYGGGNVTLDWDTTNATKVYINNGVGYVPVDGTKTVFVDSNTTFTLTAYGTDGNDNCTASVSIGEQKVPKCDYLQASDYNVEEGDKVTLTWETTNATEVSLNQGIGQVARDGSINVTVYNDTTYILTAENGNLEDTCQVTIEVEDDEPETPRCDFLRVDDDDVEEGDRVTLTWETTNADEVYIDHGIGYVSADGSEDVRVYDDITYTLTAYNDGKEDECEVDIEVTEEEDESETPRCELDISDDRVAYGDIVTLSWETENAEEITIEDDHGEEIFNSSRSKYFDGEIDVRVYEDTEFTLTVEGEDRDRDCDVDVEVEDEEITIYQKRDYGGIVFTEVPYTGFEAGPALAALFYSLLVLWALFVAYILAIKRDSIFGFKLPQAAVASNGTSDELKKKVQALLNRHNNLGW